MPCASNRCSRTRSRRSRPHASTAATSRTGGLRTHAEFARALALGADSIVIANSATQAIGCIGAQICNTNLCSAEITTQKFDSTSDWMSRRLPTNLHATWPRLSRQCKSWLARFLRVRSKNKSAIVSQRSFSAALVTSRDRVITTVRLPSDMMDTLIRVPCSSCGETALT